MSKTDKTSHDTRKEILKEQGKEKQKETLGGYKHKPSVLSKTDKTEPSHNTRKEVAEDLNWSTGKVAQADVITDFYGEISNYRSRTLFITTITAPLVSKFARASPDNTNGRLSASSHDMPTKRTAETIIAMYAKTLIMVYISIKTIDFAVCLQLLEKRFDKIYMTLV